MNPKIYLFFLFACISVGRLSAQSAEGNFFKTENEKINIITSAVEFDPSMSIVAGYGRILPVIDRNVLLNAAAGFPIFILPDLDHTYLTVDASVFFLKGDWNIKSKIGMKYKYFDNLLSEGSNMGGYLSITPGYYSDKWFAGLDLLYKQYFLTYFKHKNYYTRWFPEAENGWYYNSCGFFYISLKGGYTFSDIVEVNLRVSYKIANTLETYDPFTIPIAAGVGVSYSF